MKFEKFILILVGSVFSASFSVSVQAEKLQDMDAIWDAVGVVNGANKAQPKGKAPVIASKTSVARKIAQKKAAQLEGSKEFTKEFLSFI